MLNAAMVCVDYSDLLAVTLPYNRHHFDRVLIVTTHADEATRILADRYNCEVHITDAFYRGGAAFNKWLALEEALDERMFRRGWLCLMDADVLWPKSALVHVSDPWLVVESPTGNARFTRGQLVSPLRRMAPWPLLEVDIQWEQFEGRPPRIVKAVPVLPAEELWHVYPVHRNVGEHAGYSQIFHCDDSKLGAPPWHEVDWEHAGGADSIFQRKWLPHQKLRPPFEVLHLGEPGQNWYGRATPLADGTLPADAEAKRKMCYDIWQRRRAIRAAGGDEAATFAPEKLNG